MEPAGRNQEAFSWLKRVTNRGVRLTEGRKDLLVGTFNVHRSATTLQVRCLRWIVHHKILLAIDLAQHCIAAPRVSMKASTCAPSRDEQTSSGKPISAGINCLVGTTHWQCERIRWKE